MESFVLDVQLRDGSVVPHELVRGGGQKAVTDANKGEYVAAVVKAELQTSCAPGYICIYIYVYIIHIHD